MKIIYAGSGEFGLPALRALLDAGHNIELIVSQPDRPAGRGRHLTPTPIAQFAIEKKLPLLRTESINNESLPSADLLIVVAFGQKISPEKVTLATLGSINLHGSRLPKFRGAAPVNAAILAGDKITGNSIIRLAQKMDAGAILGQSQLDISDEMDVEADRARYESDRARDIALSGVHGIDEAMKANRLDALLFPGANGAAIAAKPGYPTVIVPFGMVPNAPAPPFPPGFDAKPSPFGVSFTGMACSEPRLLELAYAFEQATRRRIPPPSAP